MEAGLKEEFIFFECLLFGALISATDPGNVHPGSFVLLVTN